MGLDIATATGWSHFEDDRLLERGTIQLLPTMDLPQKLHYFHLELKHLLQRLKPEYCFIEDVFLGISGAKILAYLARLNGVAINTCFEILQEKIKLYEPTYWKSNSFPNLSGQAKKWEIQLAVIKHYNIPITGNFNSIFETVNSDLSLIDEKKEIIHRYQLEINKDKTSLNRKRNPLDEGMISSIKCKIKECEKICFSEKQEIKRLQKEFDKKMEKVKTDITAQTGFTENISDSCGIAYCGFKEINHV
jgi:Holliday junction resolvasome RuvABC endonuclease subunit